MLKTTASHHTGFSLIELVIVVVILAIISAIAIPRLSRSSRSAGGAALKQNLAALRSAIELYAAEHNGIYPDANIAAQLTGYSNATGTLRLAIADADQKIVYGPYIKEIPPMPVGDKTGVSGIYVTSDPSALPQQGGANYGWWYNETTLVIRANLSNSARDDDDVPYNTY